MGASSGKQWKRRKELSVRNSACALMGRENRGRGKRVVVKWRTSIG